MRESCPDISISETELPICIATADKYIASLCLNDRMVLTSSDLFNFLACQIRHKLWHIDILGRAMTKLPLLPVAKCEQTPACSQHQRVLTACCHCFHDNFGRLFEQSSFFLH